MKVQPEGLDAVTSSAIELDWLGLWATSERHCTGISPFRPDKSSLQRANVDAKRGHAWACVGMRGHHTSPLAYNVIYQL